jgi:histidinol dehydrogenase
MLARLDLRGPTADLRALPARGAARDDVVAREVAAIIEAVRTRGDAAVRDLTREHDGADLPDPRVPLDDLDGALRSLTGPLRDALAFAHDQIRAWHEAQRPSELELARGGVRLRERVVPVARAGCYVPGGRAAYPSTVLMTAVPARVAGVGEVVCCVPPDRDGSVPAVTLAAAALAGVDTVLRIGGAQAIAALALGTGTIPAVDVVVGPGNAYVTEAKRQLVGVVGIDGLAGPSELAVVAAPGADARLVAADLLAQAEHGPGGAAYLVTWDPDLVDAVEAALDAQLVDARRAELARATLGAGGHAVLVDGPEAAIEVTNALAPEHLELHCEDPEALLPLVRNAGAVFCGSFAPAAVGDYVAGVNHVLPTGGTARFASALRVDDFLKHVHVVSLDAEGLAALAPHVAALACAEGLDAHARSVQLRERRP